MSPNATFNIYNRTCQICKKKFYTKCKYGKKCSDCQKEYYKIRRGKNGKY